MTAVDHEAEAERAGYKRHVAEPVQRQQHTLGPWRYEKTDEGYDIKTERFGVLVAYTGTNHIDEANARLIAAAPDLLEALKAAVGWMPEGPEEQQARAAITKAKGEQQ